MLWLLLFLAALAVAIVFIVLFLTNEPEHMALTKRIEGLDQDTTYDLIFVNNRWAKKAGTYTSTHDDVEYTVRLDNDVAPREAVLAHIHIKGRLQPGEFSLPISFSDAVLVE